MAAEQALLGDTLQRLLETRFRRGCCRPLERSPTQWLAEQLRERLELG